MCNREIEPISQGADCGRVDFINIDGEDGQSNSVGGFNDSCIDCLKDHVIYNKVREREDNRDEMKNEKPKLSFYFGYYPHRRYQNNHLAHPRNNSI